ncbi:type II secretion system minor pseudopilin GspJ [Sphingobium boeckii]|uniref:Type II secretion system protein J n=1 Tax=Sphingobium boeckii TaxID=1082345 RepID=A0A7W9AL05_9SPHN|nr:general secretion pathway protein J [Sphingobium boeckii]
MIHGSSQRDGFTLPWRSAENGFTPLRRSTEHGFTPPRRSAENGFTLVELLVSLLIFGMLASAGVALLSFSVRAQASAQRKLDGMAEVRRLAGALTGDLAQAIPRITRGDNGDRLPAFQGTSGGEGAPFLTLIRTGWSNAGNAPRSSLQKVEYRLNAGRIERMAYAMPDGGTAQPGAALFKDVAAVKLRFRVDNDWQDRWEPTRTDAMPRAVELMITPARGAAIRQLFLVGSGYRQ